MKKILILGAGIYQLPLIKLAKEKGLYVIVSSIEGNYPGFQYADKVYYADTTDYEAILKIAQSENIDAITTTGTDVAMISIGYVCDKMNLPGISFESAQKCTDKSKMKECFVQNDVPTAPFYRAETKEEALEQADALGYPVMLKVVDRSGSRGITKTNTPDELLQAYDYANTFSNKGYFVVEKYVEGHEFGIDAFVQDGEIKAIVPHEKIMFFSEYTGIPMGHICPMDMSQELEEKIEAVSKKAINALGLDNCAVNMDVFRLPDDDISVIEATGRCGATGIPEVLSFFLGVDYYEAILKVALGEKVTFPERANRPAASYLLFSSQDGILDEIQYTYKEQIHSNEDFAQGDEITLSLDVKKGDHVDSFQNGTQRVGQVIMSSDSPSELTRKMQSFIETVKVICQ